MSDSTDPDICVLSSSGKFLSCKTNLHCFNFVANCISDLNPVTRLNLVVDQFK